MHKEEEALLFRIGRGYGLKDWQVQSLIDSDEQYEMNIPDNYYDRMNLLHDLVLMIYADGIVDKHEVQFCEEAVTQFGLKKELLPFMLKIFDKGTPPHPDEWEHNIKDRTLVLFLLPTFEEKDVLVGL
jgi:hypothetical protein